LTGFACLLYDTIYAQISISSALRSEIADKNTSGKGGRRLWQNLGKRIEAQKESSGSRI
jgi:hypothetical protein